jgi:dTDP-4-dehydrorhamnose reductase
MKVLILGATGMLGGAMLREFQSFAGEVFASCRAPVALGLSEVDCVLFDAKSDDPALALSPLSAGDYVINCIGVIKAEIDENSEKSRRNATEVNSNFPSRLADEAERRGIRVIQIATDCAFSGRSGHYSETSAHDAIDHYGRTKSAGEIRSSQMMHLRVSIIGPETVGHKSLYDWVALRPFGAQITGYKNHTWNGIPAKHFAKIARGIIESGIFFPGVHHVVPKDSVTKCELVKMIAAHVGRSDLKIVEGLAQETVNRTLTTNDEKFNDRLWAAAGYSTVPSVAELVAEI